MSQDSGNRETSQPHRSRAVFSLEDFALIKEAVRHYIPRHSSQTVKREFRPRDDFQFRKVFLAHDQPMGRVTEAASGGNVPPPP